LKEKLEGAANKMMHFFSIKTEENRKDEPLIHGHKGKEKLNLRRSSRVGYNFLIIRNFYSLPLKHLLTIGQIQSKTDRHKVGFKVLGRLFAFLLTNKHSAINEEIVFEHVRRSHVRKRNIDGRTLCQEIINVTRAAILVASVNTSTPVTTIDVDSFARF
jgi:hypothetical protein